MIKKTYYSLLTLCIALLAMSCSDEPSAKKGYDQYAYADIYSTIVGNVNDGYVLLGDKHNIAILAKGTNLEQLTMNGNKRAHITIRYNYHNLEELPDGTFVFHDAEFVKGEVMPVSNVLTKQQAEDAGAFLPDSCFEISDPAQVEVWTSQDYITVQGNYLAAAAQNGITTRPLTIDLVWDEEHSTEGTLAVRLIYNRHHSYGYDKLVSKKSINSFLYAPINDWINSHNVKTLELRNAEGVIKKCKFDTNSKTIYL